MKILYITTVGLTMGFFKSIVRELTDAGHHVDLACNDREYKVPECFREWGCEFYPIDCSRNPFSPANIRAVSQIRKIARENKYDIVHCHTPVAGACTRFACGKLRKHGLRVIYTAHGFHFYKGAPLLNWLIYYPVEKLCAKMTDTIITINSEDYELAGKKLLPGHVEYVPGVGVDVDKFRDADADRDEKRRELGIPGDAFLLLSVGELNANKNHQAVIRALARLNDSQVHYLLAGIGPKQEELERLAAELGVSRQVHIAGYRDDVPQLYKTADVQVLPSVREGLGLVSIEGMAAGLPLICADNRGTREYAGVFEEHGFQNMCETIDDYVAAIRRLKSDPDLYFRLCRRGYPAAEKFSLTRVNRKMMEIYEEK